MRKKMNSIAKRMVLMSLMLTILLIITTGIYLNAFLKSKDAENIINSGESILKSPQIIIAFIVIVLGIAAFLFILFKKTVKDKNSVKLNEEYDLAFEEMKEYIEVSGLTLLEKRELTNEILSLFLEAQNNGKKVCEVIGEDNKQFIDNMIKAYGVNDYLMYDLLTGMQYFIFYIIAMNALLFYVGRSTSFFSVKLDYALLLFFGINSFLMLPLIYRSKRNTMIKKTDNKTGFFLNPIILSVGILLLFISFMEIIERFFSHLQWAKTLLKEGIVFIKSPITLIVMLLFIVTIYYLKKKIRSIDIY